MVGRFRFLPVVWVVCLFASVLAFPPGLGGQEQVDPVSEVVDLPVVEPAPVVPVSPDDVAASQNSGAVPEVVSSEDGLFEGWVDGVASVELVVAEATSGVGQLVGNSPVSVSMDESDIAAPGDGGPDVDDLFADPVVDPTVCFGLAATIIGTPGDDVLVGTFADDVIVGLGGNDTISGGAGSDTICGGDGDDSITGESQADFLFGDAGNDTISGDSDADLLSGGDGNDSLDGGSQADTLLGGDGDDELNGGPGPDVLDGGNGVDVLDGSFQNDSCDDAETVVSCETQTRDGEDGVVEPLHPDAPPLCNGLVPSIVGTPGNDTLQGTFADDVIVGLGGNDTICLLYTSPSPRDQRGSRMPSSA